MEAICELSDAAIGENTRIEIVTGQCHYPQHEPAHFNTGWKSALRMHIEEVRMSKHIEAG